MNKDLYNQIRISEKNIKKGKIKELRYGNMVECEKCSGVMFLVKKIRKLKDRGLMVNLICNKCGNKLKLQKYREYKVELIKRKIGVEK